MELEEIRGLTPNAYRKVVDFIKKDKWLLYDYLDRRGYILGTPDYIKTVSSAKLCEGTSMDDWNNASGTIKNTRISHLDSFYGELKLLSETAVRNGRILYAGCSNGDITEWIRMNTGAEIIGVDYSKKMLDRYTPKGEDVILSDCANLPFENKGFNQIISTGVVPDRSVLKEFNRIIKPGGELVISMGAVYSESFSNKCESYEKFMDDFSENHADHVASQIPRLMELYAKNNMESLIQLAMNGFYAKHVYTKSMIIPRGNSESNMMSIPFALVGKKFDGWSISS